MAKTMAQRELQRDNDKVLDAVVAGESFLITRNGVPVAELRPIQQPRRTFVPTSGFFSDPLRETIKWERFRSDLDEVVDQDPLDGSGSP
jgi:antitoxin (DNA-binding transcriptional repressor) of toxin-antitoxin stability system